MRVVVCRQSEFQYQQNSAGILFHKGATQSCNPLSNPTSLLTAADEELISGFFKFNPGEYRDAERIAMITWIQRVFQRHNKWLFSLLLIVIIVAFVLTITPAGSGLSRGEGKIRQDDYFGVNMASESEVRALVLDAQVSTWFTTGSQVTQFNYLLDLALNRTALLALADEIGVPTPSESQLEENIRSNPKFANPDGSFNSKTYDDFRKGLRTNSRFTEAMVHKAMIEDYRIQQVSEALTGPGYVQSKEAREKLKSEKTLWSVEVATLDYQSYEPEIEIEEEKLEEYYESNKTNYEERPKAKVTAIHFTIANFRDAAAEELPDEAILESYFQKNKARFDKKPNISLLGSEDEQDSAAVDDAETTFAEARSQVEQAWIDDKANSLAEVKAFDFTELLYERNIDQNSPEMEELIRASGAEKITLEPYAQNRRPPNTLIPLSGLNQIFNLPLGRYFTDALSSPDGASVLLIDGMIFARIPELDEVREVAEANYREIRRKELFIKNGEEIQERIETGLKTGQSFQELTEIEEMETTAFEDFTSKNPPSGFNRALFVQNENLEPGQVSPMVFLQNKANFVYLKSKDLPDIPADSSEIETYAKSLAQSVLPANSYALVSEIVNQERAKSGEQNEDSSETGN